MKIQHFVESKKFEYFIVTIITINAITLGMETVHGMPSAILAILGALDKIFLTIFVTELVLKMVVYRTKFFRDSWRVFDFIVVFISLLPSSGPFSVVRSLRVLRALRMVSVIPSLRKVVHGLLLAIPGLGAVAAILLLVFYVGAVMSTKLFGNQFPEWFGSIGASSYSLFQIMTLESWSMGIVRPVMETFPNAWLFFLPFILITSFTMLNLFIAVIVNAMHTETDEAVEQTAQTGKDERGQLLDEIRKLSLRVEEINRKIDQSKA